MSVGIPKKKGIFSRNFNTIFTPKTVNSTPLIVFNIPMSFLKLASLSGQEFEQTLGDAEAQESLECCNPWGHKELDTLEQLNNSNIY